MCIHTHSFMIFPIIWLLILHYAYFRYFLLIWLCMLSTRADSSAIHGFSCAVDVVPRPSADTPKRRNTVRCFGLLTHFSFIFVSTSATAGARFTFWAFTDCARWVSTWLDLEKNNGQSSWLSFPSRSRMLEWYIVGFCVFAALDKWRWLWWSWCSCCCCWWWWWLTLIGGLMTASKMTVAAYII